MEYKGFKINFGFESDEGRFVAKTTNSSSKIQLYAKSHCIENAQDKIKDEINGYLRFCENNGINPIKNSENEKT